MRPPVKSELFTAVWRWPIALERGRTAHLNCRLSSLPLNLLCDSPLGCEPSLQWRKAQECPRSYTGRPALSRNDLARILAIRGGLRQRYTPLLLEPESTFFGGRTAFVIKLPFEPAPR